MRTSLTFVVASILTAFAMAADPVIAVPENPCRPANMKGGPYVYLSLGPVINANIKCWMSPGIISGALIFFFVFAPLFFIWTMMTCAIQSPLILEKEAINWGKIEETDD
jgi:hypothetical protein